MAICNPKFLGASIIQQVVKPKEQKLRVVQTNVSRRDAMLSLTTGTLCGFTFLFSEAAEGRVGRLENKKKVMEKLEKLREKARASRPELESYAQKPPGEIFPPTLVPPLSFPNSKELSPGPVIEAMLP